MHYYSSPRAVVSWTTGEVHKSGAAGAHRIRRSPRRECAAPDLCRHRFGGSRRPGRPSGKGVRGAARLSQRDHRRHSAERTRWYARSPLSRQPVQGLVGRRAGHNPQCCGGDARARELEGVMTLPFETARISPKRLSRRSFIGGSDARIIMGSDEPALLQLWREKRGEVKPEDLSANLIVQLGLVTEPLNRHWFERNTGHVITQVQRQVQHPVIRWMAATLDGIVEQTGAVFEAKFMLPWSFSRGGRGRKIHPAAPAQYVGHKRQGGGALDYHRRRQMGGDHHPGRFPLPAPPAHGREKILALR